MPNDEHGTSLTVEALRQAHEELERRVEERTADLVKANAELKREIQEHKQTEAALEKVEEQLRQAQKMEAVGRLAGGIAHDFNNLLSVIISYTTMLAADVDAGSSIAQDLNEIKKAGERAADLTRQLLAFSRRQVLAPAIVDLNEIIARMDKLLRRVIGEDIELCTVPGPALGKTKADPGQIEQVIMNLVVNARDAMPHGGKLIVQTANVDLDEEYARQNLGVTPGPHVMLSVSDTGVGIDDATRARIFEPFFTTKEQGKGTGLGLSTVFGIVKQSGGNISVESAPGHGTTFRLYFAGTIESPSETTPYAIATSFRGSETIMLVEDEDQVRTLVLGILKRHGYRVIEARHPSEALLLSTQCEDGIDLLVTDVVMPQMNGRQLAQRLQSSRPDMQVLYVSGYTDNAIDPGGVLELGIAFLQKPITPLALTRMVRQVLDARVRR